MDFTLTEEQQMLRDTARDLFAKECPLDFVRTAWNDRDAASKLWTAQLSGWLDLATADLVDVALFAEEHGRATAPGEFFASLLAAQVAAAAGRRPAGTATVAVSDAAGLWVPHAGADKHFVPSAGEVDEIFVVGGSP
ncbi:MAG: hypothetical protein ACE5FL_16060, partial [Myxococcota bacterium]